MLTFTSMYLTFLLVRVELDDAPGTTFILFTSSRIPRDRATWNKQHSPELATCVLVQTVYSNVFLSSSRTSNLNVPDLQWHRASLRADDVILSSLSHLTLQGLKLTVNVWKPISSRSTTLHLKPPEHIVRISKHTRESGWTGCCLGSSRVTERQRLRKPRPA